MPDREGVVARSGEMNAIGIPIEIGFAGWGYGQRDRWNVHVLGDVDLEAGEDGTEDGM